MGAVELRKSQLARKSNDDTMNPAEYKQDAKAAINAVWSDLVTEAKAVATRLDKLPVRVHVAKRVFWMTSITSVRIETTTGRAPHLVRGEVGSSISSFINEVWRDPAVVLRVLRRMEAAVLWLKRLAAAVERDWAAYIDRHEKAMREISAQAAKRALQSERG